MENTENTENININSAIRLYKRHLNAVKKYQKENPGKMKIKSQKYYERQKENNPEQYKLMLEKKKEQYKLKKIKKATNKETFSNDINDTKTDNKNPEPEITN